MICAKPQRTFFYCHRCRHNPANMPPTHDYRMLETTYPEIEPVSGDCLDFAGVVERIIRS